MTFVPNNWRYVNRRRIALGYAPLPPPPPRDWASAIGLVFGIMWLVISATFWTVIGVLLMWKFFEWVLA